MLDDIVITDYNSRRCLCIIVDNRLNWSFLSFVCLFCSSEFVAPPTLSLVTRSQVMDDFRSFLTQSHEDLVRWWFVVVYGCVFNVYTTGPYCVWLTRCCLQCRSSGRGGIFNSLYSYIIFNFLYLSVFKRKFYLECQLEREEDEISTGRDSGFESARWDRKPPCVTTHSFGERLEGYDVTREISRRLKRKALEEEATMFVVLQFCDILWCFRNYFLVYFSS